MEALPDNLHRPVSRELQCFMTSEERTLRNAVGDLAASDAVLRAGAARILFAAGGREWSKVRKEVLACDLSWNALFRCLSDQNARLVENATGAIALIIARYRRDLAAFKPLRALLKHRSKSVRTFAARGLAYLDHPDRWNVLQIGRAHV